MKDTTRYEYLALITCDEGTMLKRIENISGAYIIASYNGRYLMCYNTFREQWEIPAGKREAHESPRQCAVRELQEETNQDIEQLEFVGLLRSLDTINGKEKLNPVYYGVIEQMKSFVFNVEVSKITLWDLNENIGKIDQVDKELLLKPFKAR